MSREQVSRWARRYVVASASFLVLWQAGLLLAIPRRTSVTLGLFGFVLHMVFGKAYSLVPSYFDRQLTWGWAPGVQFPLTTLGTVGLATAPLSGVPTDPFATAGAVLWALGVAIFLAALLWTIRSNLTGSETATGGVNEERQPVDRFANAFVPVALAYLALGTYATLAAQTGLPALVDGYAPRATHLLGAGTATLLVFAIGFRLLPRFMVATPSRWLVQVVLPSGAIAPLLLAISLPSGPLFPVAALLQAVAIAGFAIAVGRMYRVSDRRRVGFYAVLAGAGFGVLGVLLGLHFAFTGQTADLVTVHYRVNLLGFLGLTIVGVAFQFYPPNAGTFPGATDRTARGVILGLVTGLGLQVVGVVTAATVVHHIGAILALGGALGYAYLLVRLFRERAT